MVPWVASGGAVAGVHEGVDARRACTCVAHTPCLVNERRRRLPTASTGAAPAPAERPSETTLPLHPRRSRNIPHHRHQLLPGQRRVLLWHPHLRALRVPEKDCHAPGDDRRHQRLHAVPPIQHHHHRRPKVLVRVMCFGSGKGVRRQSTPQRDKSRGGRLDGARRGVWRCVAGGWLAGWRTPPTPPPPTQPLRHHARTSTHAPHHMTPNPHPTGAYAHCRAVTSEESKASTVSGSTVLCDGVATLTGGDLVDMTPITACPAGTYTDATFGCLAW